MLQSIFASTVGIQQEGLIVVLNNNNNNNDNNSNNNSRADSTNNDQFYKAHVSANSIYPLHVSLAERQSKDRQTVTHMKHTLQKGGQVCQGTQLSLNQ